MFWSSYGWLCSADALQVSLSVFSSHFVIDALGLEVYRCDLDAATSMHGSIDPMESFRGVQGCLHGFCAYPVSLLNFRCMADLYRFGFHSSMLMVPNESVQTFCRTDGWHRRHW